MFNVIGLSINFFTFRCGCPCGLTVRNIENGNSQLEHEKVCLNSICLKVRSMARF